MKNQTALAQAFVELLSRRSAVRERMMSLAMVGVGRLRAQPRAILNAAGLGALVWLPGERADVADVLRDLDCFVLPSLAAGISKSICTTG